MSDVFAFSEISAASRGTGSVVVLRGCGGWHEPDKMLPG
jgi:hypothetical protein